MIGACLVGFAALSLLGWTLLSTGWVLHPKARAGTAMNSLPADIRILPLTAHDGRPFQCWVMEHPTPKATIITCHGYRTNRLQLSVVADALRRQGYCVIGFDLRGHGTRRGWCTFGVEDTHDVEAIIEWIGQQPALADKPWGVLGWSMGGAIACQTATRHPSCRAIVVDSAYARLFPVLARAIRREHGLPTYPWSWLTWQGVRVALRSRLTPLDPVEQAPRCAQPLLLIHGADDPSVPVTDALTLAAAWRGPAQQWIQPKAAHVGAYGSDPAGYCARLVHFFDQWLTIPAP